jgi:CBS domain-containing protein
MPDTTAGRFYGSYLMPTLENATVADAMHPGVLTCAPDASVTEVARMMATHHVHCIVVMDSGRPGSESRVLGMISDLDVVGGGIQAGGEQTAAALARRPMVSVERTTSLRTAAEVMLRERAAHVLVTDHSGERPVGVLSTLDVAGVLAWGEGYAEVDAFFAQDVARTDEALRGAGLTPLSP